MFFYGTGAFLRHRRISRVRPLYDREWVLAGIARAKISGTEGRSNAREWRITRRRRSRRSCRPVRANGPSRAAARR